MFYEFKLLISDGYIFYINITTAKVQSGRNCKKKEKKETYLLQFKNVSKCTLDEL